MKHITLFFLLFLSSNVFSQSTEDLLKFSYEMYKDYKKPSLEKVKSVTYNPDITFIKSKYSKDNLISYIDFFITNAKIALEQKDKNHLNVLLNSDFPTYYQEELFGIVSLKSTNSELKDSKNKEIKMGNSNANSMGGKIKENSNSEFEYRSIENQTVAFTNNVNLKGTITYELSILTDYSTQKLTKQDTGKTIVLNHLKYEVVEIIGNKVILKKLYDFKYDGNIKILLFDKNKNLIVSDDGNRAQNSLLWTGKIDSTYYNFISKNPNATFDEFKKHIKLENMMSKNPEYIIITAVSNLDNEFVIYEPEYNASKEFKVKL
ncbi:hypothetical protein [Flavobacterium sp. PS2]|uniref:hypothetical protein n=1 Tax=Flavobacterium sp. PS2 TaxID=3384157 RepID=UPI00390C7396